MEDACSEFLNLGLGFLARGFNALALHQLAFALDVEGDDDLPVSGIIQRDFDALGFDGFDGSPGGFCFYALFVTILLPLGQTAIVSL